jgi:hypothetical protein
MDSTTCLFMAFMKIFFHFCILDYPQVFAKLIARAAKDPVPMSYIVAFLCVQ